MYYVNVYLQDRAYGGPEEGGWWYECGQFQRCFPTYTRTKAERVANLVDTVLGKWNTNRNSDTGSVLSEGRYVCFIEKQHGVSYPRNRPFYE